MKISLRNARVVDPSGKYDGMFDIFIVDGFIQEIGNSIGGNPVNHEINLRGRFVVPGLFDMHTHLREPGQEYKEEYRFWNFSSGKWRLHRNRRDAEHRSCCRFRRRC